MKQNLPPRSVKGPKKQLKTKKINSKIVKKIVGIAMAASVVAFVVFSNIKTNNLRNKDEINDNLATVGVDKSYYNKPVLFHNGSPVKLNVLIKDLTENDKTKFVNFVNEMQRICDALESGYQFNLQFYEDVSLFEEFTNCINIYSISWREIQNTHGRDCAAYTRTTSYCWAIPSGVCRDKASVYISEEAFENHKNEDFGYSLETILRHEVFGHDILGLEDAYLIEKYNKDTIMNGQTYYSLNDIKLAIASIAKDPKKVDPDEIYKLTDKFYGKLEYITEENLNKALESFLPYELMNKPFVELKSFYADEVDDDGNLQLYNFANNNLNYIAKTIFDEDYHVQNYDCLTIDNKFIMFNSVKNFIFAKKGNEIIMFNFNDDNTIDYCTSLDVLTEKDYNRAYNFIVNDELNLGV